MELKQILFVSNLKYIITLLLITSEVIQDNNMKHKNLQFLFQFIILYFECSFIIVQALLGHEIRETVQYEFPAVVGIASHIPGIPLKDRLKCTGTLISLEHVLTSDHCFTYFESNRLDIIVGSHNLRNGLVCYPLWGISFDNWAQSNNQPRPCQENDLAILKIFGNAFVFTPMPINNISPHSWFNQRQLDVAGFGQVNGDLLTLTMHATTVKVLGDRKCNRLLSFIEERKVRVPSNYMCTSGNPYRYLAPGDSGGPLIFNGTLVAVNKGTSPATNIIHPNKVNSHISIDFYRHYINAILLY